MITRKACFLLRRFLINSTSLLFYFCQELITGTRTRYFVGYKLKNVDSIFTAAMYLLCF